MYCDAPQSCKSRLELAVLTALLIKAKWGDPEDRPCGMPRRSAKADYRPQSRKGQIQHNYLVTVSTRAREVKARLPSTSTASPVISNSPRSRMSSEPPPIITST